jgi:CheY-like chemotaxis protein
VDAETDDGLRVLVIDDDPNVCDLMKRHLVKEGFHVELAESGEHGIELAKTNLPDVITLDVMMPGMDGWTVLNELKSNPTTSEIPVIMVTIVDDKNLGFSLGAVDYLTKPVDWNRLKSVLEKIEEDKNQPTVLVVEDDPATRESLATRLAELNWTILEADNGRRALESMAAVQPDLILLDLLMPEMDGFEFMENIRAHADWRFIPVVVITAMELSESERKRLNGDVIKIIEKHSHPVGDLVLEIVEAIRSKVTR